MTFRVNKTVFCNFYLMWLVRRIPTNGPDAVATWKLHQAEIALLLTDLMMPGGMSGKALGEQILKCNPKLKVIYVSGYSADIAGGDFQVEEGVNFLTKPFEIAKLAQIVRKCLE